MHVASFGQVLGAGHVLGLSLRRVGQPERVVCLRLDAAGGVGGGHARPPGVGGSRRSTGGGRWLRLYGIGHGAARLGPSALDGHRVSVGCGWPLRPRPAATTACAGFHWNGTEPGELRPQAVVLRTWSSSCWGFRTRTCCRRVAVPVASVLRIEWRGEAHFRG